MPFYYPKTETRRTLRESEANDVIQGYANLTTIHGVPHIYKAKGKCEMNILSTT
jgi:hypothetical protein